MLDLFIPQICIYSEFFYPTDIEEPTISLSSDSPLWREDTVIVLGQPSTPQELVLNCSIEAHPTPTLYWNRRDGNFMREVDIRDSCCAGDGVRFVGWSVNWVVCGAE